MSKLDVYIVRHAVAEDKVEWAMQSSDDSLRPLTAKGAAKMKKLARKYFSAIGKVDLILTSPYVRAQQTADILHQEFSKADLKQSQWLIPTNDPSKCIANLQRQIRSCKRVILVGHQPHLGDLISVLLTGDKGLSIDLKKGSLTCLRFKEGKLTAASASLRI